jgi:predicted molibdopterin-dependent oxidoreductase YjgC
MAAVPRREGYTKGQVCSRGRFCIPQLLNGSDRLKQPMIRKNGKLIPVNWDEALAYVIENLKNFTNDQIGVIASPSLTNESAYILQKFARVALHTNNIDVPTTDFINPIMNTLVASGSPISNEGKIKNLEKAKWIIILGRKIFLPSSALNPSIYIAKKKGAKIILIDNEPKSKTPKYVDVNLKLGVQQAMNLFNGIIYNLFNSNPKLAKDCVNYNSFAQSVKNTAIKKLGKDISEHVEKITKIIEHSKGCIIFDQGAIRCSNPEKIVNAIMNVLILSKNPEGFIPYYDGGNDQGVYDMGATYQYLPGYTMISDPASSNKFERLWGTALPKKGKNYHEMLNGGVKALYLTETVPGKNLRSIEFLILQDIYPSKIMDKADVVLPACAFTEENGTVTSLERRVQKITKAVGGPGLAKPDWRIICDLVKKMGIKGFDYNNHQNIFREIKEAIPFISSTGVWVFKDKQLRLFPLSIEEKIKKLPPSHLRYDYRGADIIERVDDFRLQIEGGGA